MNWSAWRLDADLSAQETLDHTSLNRYQEQILQSKDGSQALRRALVQGSQEVASKLAKSDKHHQTIGDVSASVAAPFLIDYTLWTLQKAKEEGIERLFFLARDAQCIRDIAEKLAPLLEIHCELQYLLVSRKAINLAAAGGLHSESSSLLFSRITRMTASELGERLHLDAQELRDVLHLANLPESFCGEHLGAHAATAILDVLRQDECRLLISNRANQARQRVIPYLRQEGVLEPVRVGVVDLGGTATQFRAIASLRREEGLSRPVGFLVCRYTNPPLDGTVEVDDRAGCERLHVYLSDDVRGTGPRRFTALITLLEVFCAADHGRVSGYEERSGRWVPVTDSSFGTAIKSWGLATLRESIDTVLRHFVRVDMIQAARITPAQVAITNLRSFVLTPSREEATAWGSYPCLDDVGPTLAQGMNFSDLVSTFRHRELPIQSRRWWPASLQLSPLWLRASVRTMKALRVARSRTMVNHGKVRGTRG